MRTIDKLIRAVRLGVMLLMLRAVQMDLAMLAEQRRRIAEAEDDFSRREADLERDIYLLEHAS